MLKNNSQRAKYIIIFFSILFTLNIAAIVSDLLQYSLINSIDGYTIEEAELNDLRQQIIGVLTFISYILCYIFFILWFRRAYFNLHQVVKNLEYSEGWAAGAWFVPIVNFFKPYKIMRELYVETENYIYRIKSDYKMKLNVTFVGIWWFLWIVSTILDRIGMRMNLRAETLDELNNATQINLATEFLTIPLCLIIIKVVKDYSNVEKELFEIEKNKNLEVSDNTNEVITTTE